VLLDDPQVRRYGLEIMRATGLASGTLYPILTRLQETGWVRADWEDIDSSVEGRPARRYYSLTPRRCGGRQDRTCGSVREVTATPGT